MSKIIIGGQEFDSLCPLGCPDYGCKFGMNSLCFRCPILNCVGEQPLLRPEDYRPDWAKAWRDWFDGGMEGLPELYF